MIEIEREDRELYTKQLDDDIARLRRSLTFAVDAWPSMKYMPNDWHENAQRLLEQTK